MYRFLLYHPTLKRNVQISDPMGWDAERKTIERDPALHGVFTKYSPELKFVNDGRRLIVQLYNTFGIEADITITIERKDVKTRQWVTQYQGRLDLTTLQIDKLFAIARLNQTSLFQKFKNRQDVPVSMSATVDMDGNAMPTPFDLSFTMHSKKLKKQLIANGNEEAIRSLVAGTYYFIPGFAVNEIFNELDEKFNYPTQISDNSPVTDLKYLILVSEAGVYDFDLKMNFLVSSQSTNLIDFTIDWFLVYGTPGNYTTTAIGPTRTGIDVVAFENTLTVTGINLPVGAEIYIYCRVAFTGTASDIKVNVGTSYQNDVVITGLTTSPVSGCKAVPIYETWQQLVRNLTGQDAFVSDYYGRVENGYAADGAGSLRAITTGSQIRELDIAKFPIYVTAKELMESCAAIDGVGMAFENNKISIKPLSDFYKNYKSMRLTYVTNLKRSVAPEYLYNSVEAGYKIWNSRGQQLNNLDEFCSKREFKLPISQVKNKLSLVSPYIAAGYSIEFLRRSIPKKTTDTEQDNSNYIISLRRLSGSFVPEKNESMTVTDVIDAGSLYNARLSPMQNLKRNSLLLTPSLNGSALALQRGEGNNDFTITIGATVTNEKNIDYAQLTPPLWKAEVYEFEATPTLEQWDEFEANPYGYVEFSSTGKDFLKGWLLQCKPDAESRKSVFKLLAAA